MRLENIITHQQDIYVNRLATVCLRSLHVKCPRCGMQNKLSLDFWTLVTDQHFNDIPGCCPYCRVLYTIHVNPDKSSHRNQPQAYNRVLLNP